MTTRRRAVTALAVAALTLAACAEEKKPAAGPVQVPDPNMSSFSVPVGHAFTDGMQVFQHEGDEPAVIESVRMVGADPGLELVGVMLADDSRTAGAVQYLDDWPPINDPDLPAESVKPLDTEIGPLPASNAELLIGMKATREGRLVRKGIWIDYRIADEDYSVYFPSGVTVCTDKRRNCRPPSDW